MAWFSSSGLSQGNFSRGGCVLSNLGIFLGGESFRLTGALLRGGNRGGGLALAPPPVGVDFAAHVDRYHEESMALAAHVHCYHEESMALAAHVDCYHEAPIV